MKNKAGKTWFIISIIIIINIFIFYFLSTKLESFVSNDRDEKTVIIDEIIKDIP